MSDKQTTKLTIDIGSQDRDYQMLGGGMSDTPRTDEAADYTAPEKLHKGVDQ